MGIDVIFVFDSQNFQLTFSLCLCRIYDRAFFRSESWGQTAHRRAVDDPYGGDAAKFRGCYSQLNLLLDEIVLVLCGGRRAGP